MARRDLHDDEFLPASQQANIGLFAQGGAPPSPGRDAVLDDARIATLESRVKLLMLDHEWRTFAEIQAVTGGSETGISATLRAFRRTPHQLMVDKRRRGDPRSGFWEYRITPSQKAVR